MRFFAILLLALLPLRVNADIAGPDPVAVRMARASMTLVGTVASIEDKPVLALPYPGAMEKVPYRVAVVKVDQGLIGTAGATHVRVGFVEMQNPRRPIQNLKADQQVLLFLKPHPQEGFQVSSVYYYGFVYGSEPSFKVQVDEAVKAAKVLANPLATLKGDDRAARAQVAGVLLHRYAAERGPNTKQEPIDAEESRLILKALAETEWNPTAPVQAGSYALSFPQTFALLGLTEADGWKPPANFKEFPDAARKWLMDNAGTYRVKRSVPKDR